jgi:hypothetical protein
MPCSPGLTRRTWQMTHWIQREIPKREMEVRVPTRGLTHESFPRSHADRPFHPFQRSPDNVRSTRSRGPVGTKPSRDFSSLTGSSTAGSSSLPFPPSLPSSPKVTEEDLLRQTAWILELACLEILLLPERVSFLFVLTFLLSGSSWVVPKGVKLLCQHQD